MKRFDISVSGTEPEDERRLFRFEFDAYYREVYRWFLRDGTKYTDGRCPPNDGSPEGYACRYNYWNVTEIQNGTEPKFFGIMEGFLYPNVSRIFLSSRSYLFIPPYSCYFCSLDPVYHMIHTTHHVVAGRYYFSSVSKKLVSNKITMMKVYSKQYEFQILFISKLMARSLNY